jgi:hypothetical protein
VERRLFLPPSATSLRLSRDHGALARLDHGCLSASHGFARRES